MAISVAWQTTVTFSAATTPCYTVPTTASAAFGTYARDLVITNGGTAALYTNLQPLTSNAATTAASFYLPAGGTLILTQCQVPGGAGVSMIPISGGTCTASIGYATNVSYI